MSALVVNGKRRMSSSDFSLSGVTLRGVELGAHMRDLGIGILELRS